jgi:methylglutaconyl-CoA hydratase
MLITTERQKHWLRVTLNRPEVHNAFNSEMIKDLTTAFKSAAKDPTLRAVILSATGKSFCAGADLEWMRSMADYSYEENLKDARILFEMFETISECPVPVLAQLHGNVMGGGVGLAAVCDIVAADRETRFGFTEVKFGLVPAVISPFVTRKVPEHYVREMMITGEIFDCASAEKMGLVHFSGENEEVGDFIEGKLDYIHNTGPEAVRSVKALLKALPHWSWNQSKEETIKLIAERRVSKEGQEGIRSFLAKRQPQWKAD